MKQTQNREQWSPQSKRRVSALGIMEDWRIPQGPGSSQGLTDDLSLGSP